MTLTVTGRVEILQSNNAVAPPSKIKAIILRPSRTDFQYTLDSGTNWQGWQGDPNLLPQYPGCVSAQPDVHGAWAITIPWTDAGVEVLVPGGGTLTWNIIDPNPTAGLLCFSGPALQATVGSSKTIEQLMALASPNTWGVSGTGVSFSALPAGPRRYPDMSFTASGVAGAILMDDIGTSSWKFTYGIESDDPTKSYTLTCDTASKTPTTAAFTLSDVPPAGKTVIAHLEVYL